MKEENSATTVAAPAETPEDSHVVMIEGITAGHEDLTTEVQHVAGLMKRLTIKDPMIVETNAVAAETSAAVVVAEEDVEVLPGKPTKMLLLSHRASQLSNKREEIRIPQPRTTTTQVAIMPLLPSQPNPPLQMLNKRGKATQLLLIEGTYLGDRPRIVTSSNY